MRQKLAHSDREEAKEHVDAAAAALESKGPGFSSPLLGSFDLSDISSLPAHIASPKELHHDPVIAAHLSAVEARDAAENEVSHRKAGLEAAQDSGDHRRILHAQARLDHAQSDLAKAKDEEGESKRGLREFRHSNPLRLTSSCSELPALHERAAVAAMIHHHATEDLNHHKRNLEEIERNPNAFSPEERAAARHAHATALERHDAARNRHRHLKDKLSLHRTFFCSLSLSFNFRRKEIDSCEIVGLTFALSASLQIPIRPSLRKRTTNVVRARCFHLSQVRDQSWIES